MNINKSTLKQIVKEELKMIINELANEQAQRPNRFAVGRRARSARTTQAPANKAGASAATTASPKKVAKETIEKWTDDIIAKQGSEPPVSVEDVRAAMKVLGVDPAFLEKIAKLSGDLVDVSRRMYNTASMRARS